MTRLELFTKVFSDFSDKSESDLLAWSEQNMDPKVRKGLSIQIPDDQVEELMAEYRANPASVIANIDKYFINQSA